MGMRGFGRLSREGQSFIDAAQAARLKGDLGTETTALQSLDAWKSGLPWETAKIYGKASLIPAEMRLGGTITMPRRSRKGQEHGSTHKAD